jgi:dissimilatory sulfite reductase (desulfoviridin) alpha/beta subunit
VEQGSEEGFTICIGGGLDAAGHIAQPLCDVTTSELVPTIRKLLDVYVANRTATQETFGQYARRVGVARYAELLGVTLTQKIPANMRNTQLQPTFEQAVAEAGGHDKAVGHSN